MEPKLSKSVAVSDNRGVFSASSLVRKGKTRNKWIQTNVSYNIAKHTFRGMHLQRAPHAQSKLLKVISGSIIDIIVDLRGGEDHMRVHWYTLEQGDELLVPKGFAHGFITLVPHTVVQYLVDAPFMPEADVSINWKSFKKIREIFNVEYKDMVISEKDTNALMLNEIKL